MFVRHCVDQPFLSNAWECCLDISKKHTSNDAIHPYGMRPVQCDGCCIDGNIPQSVAELSSLSTTLHSNSCNSSSAIIFAVIFPMQLSSVIMLCADSFS